MESDKLLVIYTYTLCVKIPVYRIHRCLERKVRALHWISYYVPPQWDVLQNKHTNYIVETFHFRKSWFSERSKSRKVQKKKKKQLKINMLNVCTVVCFFTKHVSICRFQNLSISMHMFISHHKWFCCQMSRGYLFLCVIPIERLTCQSQIIIESG